MIVVTEDQEFVLTEPINRQEQLFERCTIWLARRHVHAHEGTTHRPKQQ